MTIRRASVDDLGAVMALERASFAADAWSDSMMREELSSPHNYYVVMMQGGRVCGYAGLRASRGGRDADIQTIALAETARGRGQGRMLLTAVLAEAARRGAGEVFLDVRDDNTVAQRLYASEGFVAIGRRPKYYAAEGVDAIVMKLDLTGWVPKQAFLRSAEDHVPAEDASGQNDPPLAPDPPLSGGPQPADPPPAAAPPLRPGAQTADPPPDPASPLGGRATDAGVSP